MSEPTWTAAPRQPDETVAGDGKPAGPSTELLSFLAPAQAADELGRLGDYRIQKVLGQGGMGVVFLAEDPKLRRQVAIKAMLPHLAQSGISQQRFLREAQAAAGVEHDHIVPILHVGESRGAPYIVMPFLRGESLDSRLRRDEPVPLSLVLQVGIQAADALVTAHQRGLIHRDIKPANLWLEQLAPPSLPGESTTVPASRGPVRVKLLDFGLACLLHTNEQEHLTQTGAILGTPGYMPPEQAEGQELDGRADLFSLGCVLYVLTTRQQAFRGNSTMARLLSVAKDQPETPARVNPAIPTTLSDLIMQLLSKNREDRPASARDVLARLRGIESELTVPMPPPLPGSTLTTTWAGPVATRASGHYKRRTMPMAIGLLFLVIGGALVSWLVFRGKPAPNGTTPVADDDPWPTAFTNSIGTEFVLVRKGTFYMGGGGGKVGDKEVEIRNDFYLGVFEVTQGEWQAVMHSNPSQFSRTGEEKEAVAKVSDEELKRFPVENVSWHEVQAFLVQLNAREKEHGSVYRLPTAAEWEYACRGGSSSRKSDYGFDFYFDRPTNTLATDRANFDHKKSPKRTCKVGSYPPNSLGLYDMHGNVWEWCSDEYPAEPDDPTGTLQRVNLGGGWNSDAGYARAGYRDGDVPTHRNWTIGFRLVRMPLAK